MRVIAPGVDVNVLHSEEELHHLEVSPITGCVKREEKRVREERREERSEGG